VFVNVASKNTKSKLRVLYEVAPIGRYDDLDEEDEEDDARIFVIE
jgi:hypothetical protein